MHRQHFWIRRVVTRLQTLALVAALALLLALAGGLLGGPALALTAFMAVAGLYWLQPLMTPQWMIRIQGGRPLVPEAAPGLHQLVNQLARQSRLMRPPQLYYLPDKRMNAFTIGNGERALVGVSDGLLRGLERDEVAGVLAHEIAHIRNNDTRVMGFAALIYQLIQGLSLAGQLLLIVNLPLVLAGHPIVSLGGVLVLILAPYVGLLIQLALSRSREYLADTDAAALIGSPRPLASALAKIERHNHALRRYLWRWPGFKPVGNALLRTHPPTPERIRRLLEIEDARRMSPLNPARAFYGTTGCTRLVSRPRMLPCRFYGLCP